MKYRTLIKIVLILVVLATHCIFLATSASTESLPGDAYTTTSIQETTKINTPTSKEFGEQVTLSPEVTNKSGLSTRKTTSVQGKNASDLNLDEASPTRSVTDTPTTAFAEVDIVTKEWTVFTEVMEVSVSSLDEMDMHTVTDVTMLTEVDFVTGYGWTILTDMSGNNETNTEETLTHDSSFGWSWFPMPWTWWRILQFLCALLGIGGNTLVIIVVFRPRSRSRSTDLLVGSLAIADLFSSFLLIPYPVVHTQPATALGFWYCTIAETKVLMWTCISISTYSLVAISFDRYFAISHPLAFKRMVTRRRTSISICFVWFLGCFLSSGSVFIHKVESQTGRCVFTWVSPKAKIAFGCYNFLARLIVPVTLLLITQILTARTLHREAERFRNLAIVRLHSRRSIHRSARDRVIKLMLVVVVVFIICWTPNQLAFFLLNMEVLPRSYFKSPLHRALIVQAFFNSCLNPIIYTVRHGKFRSALLELLPGRKISNAPIFEEIGIDSSSDSAKDIKMSSRGASSTRA